MNSDFPRILTLLRKERGISQKQAASELDISQALLSHYEKGIRECGHDFVVRTADFYGVSCDYLLGRSPERNGATISVEDIPDADAQGKENTLKGSILPTLNKKLIINALSILFDMLQSVNNKELTVQVSTFLNLAVYRMFRQLYAINPKNEESMFTVSPVMAKAKAMAAMAISEATVKALIAQDKDLLQNSTKEMYISTQTLVKDYPQLATSLLNLITNSETAMEK